MGSTLEERTIGSQMVGSDPRIGQHVLHYQIVEEIGSGGMSVVYRAIDKKQNREVAVKVLHPFLATKPDCRRRLAREAKTISKLDHPHILKIFDYSREIDLSQTLTPDTQSSEVPADLFIVTELVKGMTLKEFGEKYQLWNIPELGALIVREIAKALDFAHSRNVIHRDIKPENIMVSCDGSLKLMDFGIAYVKDQESLTMTGTMLGSPAHMAPEIIEGKDSDFRSDIFSLSTVFYWLVAGELPYEGTNPHTLLRNIVEGRHRPIEEVSAKVVDSLRFILEKGMATQPAQRFQNTSEFVRALDTALISLEADLCSADIRAMLTDPVNHMTTFAQKIRESAFKRARDAFDSKNFLQGTANLNRVLADEPSHKEALLLLERNEFQEPKPKASISYGAVAMAIVLSFVVVGFWVFTSGRFAQKETTKSAISSLKKEIPAAPVAEEELKVAVPFVETEKVNPKPKVASAPPKTTITVTPFADIWIDGKEVAKNSSRFETQLALGEHTILFKHEFAATEQRTLTVKSDSKDLRLHVDLEKVKPASLIVVSNVDADIAIEGAYKGTAKESASRPILIPFPKKTHDKRIEIVISKKGYIPYIGSHTLIAGKNQTIDVTLEPEHT